MPAVLSMVGFGGRNVDRDRLTVASGTPSYSTSELPPDSASSTSITGSGISFRKSWHDDPNADAYEPSTDEFWFHAFYRSPVNNTNNDGLRIGVGAGLGEFITISAQDTTNLITIRVGGVLRATAASAAFSVGNWTRLHVHVTGNQTGDEVRVYTDGNLATPAVSYTLVSGDATTLSALNGGKPNAWYITYGTGHAGHLDDLVAWDPQDAGFPGIQFFQACSIKEQVFTGNGDEQEWSGDYTAIDELPASDTDKITAAAVGDESSFTTDAINEPNVFAVRVLARVTRTGSDAGENIMLIEREGGTEVDATMAAPGDGDVEYIFQTAPDGLAWSPVKRDASRFGFIAVT